MGIELSPEQRDRLVRFLEVELREARAASLAAGADPATLTDLIAERRRALASPTLGEDAEDHPDDPLDDPGIGE